MRIEFWGTRGSIAKPGSKTIKYGGNTSCVALYPSEGPRIILDCGTGAHGLGQALMASGEKPLRGHLFIGHTHWDHIQGLPFFVPIFVPGNEWDIYAPRGLRAQLRDTLAGQMQYTYFPVSLEQLGANIRYHDLTEGTFRIGSVTVHAQYLNHPALTLGYRFEADGVSVVYATDHEPHACPIALGPNIERRPILHAEDRRHADFFAGADLLIHDAQYTAAEYAQKIGWGHSTVDYVIEMALAARVKRLALFHHDPLRTDEVLDEIVRSFGAALKRAGETMELFAAAEGQVLTLSAPEPSESPKRERKPEVYSEAVAERRMVISAREPALVSLLKGALANEGFEISVIDPETMMAKVEAQHPAIALVARRASGWDAIEWIRKVRSHADATLRDIPIVVLAKAEDAQDMAAGFEAGATDWLTQPCSAAFIQSRVRSWLLRSRIRWIKPPMPANEAERLGELRELGILGTPREERFDRLTRLATRAMNASYAFLTLVDADRIWCKASVGIDFDEQPRDVSMCSYAILHDDVLVVPDALVDPDFGDNPAFHDELGLRFYAGVPLRGPGGHAIGTLCVYDPRPRQPTPEDLAALRDLAVLLEQEIAKKK